MKKTIWFLAIVSVFNFSYAQEVFHKFENNLKTSGKVLKQSFPVVNKKNNDFALFLLDAKEAYAYLFDKELQNIGKLSTEALPRKYKVLIGSSISKENDYRIFLTNNKETLFGVINFSFKTGETAIKELDFTLSGQRFLQTFVYKNRFFIITALQNTSTLAFYEFDDEANYIVHNVNLSSDEFLNIKGKPTALYNLLVKDVGANKIVEIEKIENSNPNAIETVSSATKMYQFDDKITLTFDENREITKIVEVSLKDFSAIVSTFKKPMQEIKTNKKRTNTFLFDDKIFTVASTDENMIFSIYEFENFELLKTYEAKIDAPIPFKNSPIIQQGGAYKQYREMEKTQKFLRKITDSDVGVSVYQHKNNYQILLGGRQDVTRGGIGFGFGFGGAVGGVAFGVGNMFFSPTFSAYNSYSTSKSTYIDCLFDENLEHISGAVEKNSFDKVYDYIDENPNIYAETLFLYNDSVLLGFPSSDNKYVLRKFED